MELVSKQRSQIYFLRISSLHALDISLGKSIFFLSFFFFLKSSFLLNEDCNSVEIILMIPERDIKSFLFRYFNQPFKCFLQ